MTMHADREDRRNRFFFIPHTHWEGAVFKTREQYLEMGLPHILQALRLLKLHPDYRFALDQVCYVKPFLERYPEEEEVRRGGATGDRGGDRCDGRRQHAGRGVVRSPDSVR